MKDSFSNLVRVKFKFVLLTTNTNDIIKSDKNMNAVLETHLSIPSPISSSPSSSSSARCPSPRSPSDSSSKGGRSRPGLDVRSPLLETWFGLVAWKDSEESWISKMHLFLYFILFLKHDFLHFSTLTFLLNQIKSIFTHMWNRKYLLHFYIVEILTIIK